MGAYWLPASQNSETTGPLADLGDFAEYGFGITVILKGTKLPLPLGAVNEGEEKSNHVANGLWGPNPNFQRERISRRLLP